MKTYKDFEKQIIGESDIGCLILAGHEENNGLMLKKLNFGEDGCYSAYVIQGNNVKIKEHYQKVAQFDCWMKIYDDLGLVRTFRANKIVVYRAGQMGCIIQLID